ncbi:N-6 DNA methylase [Thauera sp. CAU 1555]|uniref:site-specific DNA-methyltransferase (adenine-specific) n=1 Tax=Thauera sedimentorum TaxID=2767595 RepID=A0ABR9B549_9RHOO|nr:DNA methyltransferase [Thauera sedimentorum]MBC9070594.1 N-6 DNA methylase [Thauera sedimentorum]MBD8501513.1 N-6 DNA methylase [Thauera sedimentorum]
MARRNNHELAFAALSIEGALLAPDFLNKVAHLDAKSDQNETDYDIPRGLKLRDEVGRYWKIAQNLWQDFSVRRERSDVDSHAVTVRDFLEPFCRQVLGFADMRPVGQVTLDERIFPIGFAAGEGRVPLVFAAHDQGLDKPSTRHGDGVRRRSPFLLAQEYLNASSDCLWAVVSNGLKLRILRDNPSLTRPAYIEADLEAILNEGLYPDFTALWLLAHASRFGKVGAEPADCALERWRNTAQEDGIRARDRLRVGVTEALRALGTGFLAHKDNAELRRRIEAGELSTQAYFEQLLRLIYRFIFLATIEDRELVFAPDATPEARERYLSGYSLTRLRQLAARRRSYDRHADLWQVLTITFAGLGRGQPALGLPALGGLFEAAQCPDLDCARLENQALLSALFSLCFFRDGAALSRVNYRDMDSEELGSVYESLLELVPQVTLTGGARRFGFVGDEEEGSTKGNARKLTGSYYTPDSLVQELIKSALEPVIARTLAENPQEPVQALLALTVCDPACGSGHFLLAAARRIADEVALLRAPEGNPSQQDFRHALRDVVAHCIYGVDKNPMAVELARTALWLEAYTPDRPLTFLDAHLRCGDALLGVLDEAILQDGIPDKAFNALSGDDKEVVKRIKKANRDALKSIVKAKERSRQMLSLDLDENVDAASFEALPDDTLEALQAKRAAHAALEASIAASKARLAADIFVAAFVLPKTVETEARMPTSQDLWLVLNGDAPRPGIAESAHAAAQSAQAFHWWQAFPQVKARGGFDVLLGNPPWEVSQFTDEEYFGATLPSISGMRSDHRKRAISELRVGNPRLWSAYQKARRFQESLNVFFKESGRYPKAGIGRSNLFGLFVESIAHLMDAKGRSGFIVPTGFATDDSSKFLFESIIERKLLVSLFDFENRDGIFQEVHRSYKFSLVTLGSSEATELACFATRVSDLADGRRRFVLRAQDFSLINPNTMNLPVFRTQRDSELTMAIYRKWPVLSNKNSLENPWCIDIKRIFNMGVPEVAALCSNSPGSSRVRMFEAKMFHQYDHRWFGYGAGSDDRGKTDPSFLVAGRYYIDRSVVESELHGRDGSRQWLLAWRDVCRSTDERTVIASVIPRVATDFTIRVGFLNHGAEFSACFLANLNSLVLDFIARQKIGSIHLSDYITYQLPFISRSAYGEGEIAFILPRVLELTYTAHDLKPWAADLGYDGPPFPWNVERRAQLRAELDAYYARLYGLTRDELRYILDPADVMGEDYPSETFRVLKNNELREFGEYRTRRLVLAAWDAMEQDWAGRTAA